MADKGTMFVGWRKNTSIVIKKVANCHLFCVLLLYRFASHFFPFEVLNQISIPTPIIRQIENRMIRKSIISIVLEFYNLLMQMYMSMILQLLPISPVAVVPH